MARVQQDTISLLLRTEADPDTERNMNEIEKAFRQLCPICRARETGLVTLAIGDTAFIPPISRPQGRVTVYQDAASNLYDKGLDSLGRWVINSSAACNARFLFY